MKPSFAEAVGRISDANNRGYELRVVWGVGLEFGTFFYDPKKGRYDRDMKRTAEEIDSANFWKSLLLHPFLTRRYMYAIAEMIERAEERKRKNPEREDFYIDNGLGF
jgi:hypothetical protein